MKEYKNKIFAVVFILFTLLSIGYVMEDESQDTLAEENIKTEKKVEKKDEKEEVKDEKVTVDVKGQVVSPGVYELTNKNSVFDAINVAGGLTEYSDTSNINLSKKLSDEMVIIVYSKEEIRKMKDTEKVVCPPVNDACVCPEDEKGLLEEVDEGLININEATKEQLSELDGIGESKAEAIVEYRKKNGNFEKIEDIQNVSGIGEKAFEKIKDSITV